MTTIYKADMPVFSTAFVLRGADTFFQAAQKKTNFSKKIGEIHFVLNVLLLKFDGL
jgi:hypothetical protein